MTPAIEPVSWRLLGSNHRELGRSALFFPTIAECQESIAALRAAMPDVVGEVSAHWAAGYWYWRVSFADVAIAVSSRLYQRRREATQSLARALENIQLVDREPDVIRSRSGTRSDGERQLLLPRNPRMVDLRDRPETPPLNLRLEAQLNISTSNG